MNDQANSADLSVARNLKIALFHLGSGMADVLTTGVWNRIMVADLGFSATLVGLLTGLRYFLAPLGVLAGSYSDTHTVGGYRRLFWIWLGRAMVALSTVTLGFTTAELVRNHGLPTPPMLWLGLVVSFLLFSLGSSISGGTYLALIYDRAPQHQRGRAVGIVWTFLLFGFTVGGIFSSVLLPRDENAGELAFSAEAVLWLFLLSALVLSLLWIVSLLGEERRVRALPTTVSERCNSLSEDLSVVMRDRNMRFFLCYLVLSMAFAFLQDTVLEPFAGQVFGMDAQVTNRFSAYWGSMAILGSLASLFLLRRSSAFNHASLSQVGVFLLAAAYLVFAASSLAEIRVLVKPGLVLLGVGLGIWNIGTLGLMMDMSPAGRAGAFLGFWALCVTFARGAGVAGGGIARDVLLALSGQHPIAYGAVFVLGLLGMLAGWLALRYVNPAASQADAQLATMLSRAVD